MNLSEQQVPEPGNLARISTAVTAVVALVGLYLAFRLPLNHDAAWFLHISREVLGGARVYTDIIEVNPPLIIWLGVPVMLLEQATGVSHTFLFPSLVALGAALSLHATHQLSRRALDARIRPAFLVISAVVMFVLPAREWGQREHLMLLLTVPYIVACVARARGMRPGSGWFVGGAAGLGFALKPHFVVTFILLEAWLHIRRRPIWPGTFTAAAVIASYGVGVIAFTGYFRLAWEIRDIYSAFASAAPARILISPRTLMALAAVAALTVARERREARAAFGMATAGWMLAYITQGKGFDYHFIPVLAGAAYAVTLYSAGILSGPWLLRGASVAALLIAGVAAFDALSREDPRWSEIEEMRTLPTGGSAVMLSPFIPEIWPHMSYLSARWRAPIPSMWPIMTNERGRLLTVRWMVPVLEAGVPVIIRTDGDQSSLHELMKNEEFARAWSRYEPVARTDRYALLRHR
jgi:hypothetical protein